MDAALHEVDDEDDVVAEAREPVHRRHADDEREQVVDERVEEAEDEELPRQVRDALEPVARSERERSERRGNVLRP